MANSRKKRSKPAVPSLVEQVSRVLKCVVRPGDRLLVGLSGGVDSIVLLDVLARLGARLKFRLRAVHVNHQLSPNAAAWARFCRAACRERGVPCRVAKVHIVRANSIERAAREARYAEFAKEDAEHILLAHNADDQAETLLLQLFRGAGVKGLAAMPLQRRRVITGARGCAREVSVVRPLLDVPRAHIERYATRRKLRWIEDESNLDTAYLRNWVRHDVVPVIAQRVPAYRTTFSRASRNLGEAAQLLDDLARLDAGDAVAGTGLAVDDLRNVGPARAKNALRYVIGLRGWPMPEADRLEEALRQVLTARRDAKLAVDLGGYALMRHRGIVHLVPRADLRGGVNVVTWHGEHEVELPQMGGVLKLTRTRGAGLSAAQLESKIVTIRARNGGERLQTDARRPRRTVKNLLQEARVPPWQRDRLPFIYCGETLVCVPGVGVDARFQAQPGEASVVASWSALHTNFAL